MTFPHRGYAGQILYLNSEGREWGREAFSATVHGHGRSLRALCEMDAARLHREASWSVGPDWRPRDGFVRNMRDGHTIGTCWYRVEGDTVECEGVTQDHGRVSRRLVAGRPIQFLGMHPLTGDALTAMARGTDAPGEERPILCAANSTAHLGDEGLDVLLLEPLVAYIGPRTVTVRAGTFETHHFTIRWSDEVPHLTDFFVDPVDCVPVLTELPSIGERYELVSLERFAAAD